MKIEKKHIVYILIGLVVLFLIYWFFFRKKSAESGYGAGVLGSNCTFNSHCGQGLGCRSGKCAPIKRRVKTYSAQPVAMQDAPATPQVLVGPIKNIPLTQPVSGLTGASLFSGYPTEELVRA